MGSFSDQTNYLFRDNSFANSRSFLAQSLQLLYQIWQGSKIEKGFSQGF